MGRHSTRRSRRIGTNGLAAVVAQGSQAAGSLLLQVVAARSLGITGLGEFGLLYGILVLATAISSGFVGDSLTVLDRQSHQLKAALQNWLVLVAVVGAILCAVGVWATGFVEKQAAVAFGMATFVFVLEDAVRRLLMASLRFWRIVVVDATSLLVLVVVLLLAPSITLAGLFVALAAGQACAIVVGVCLLPVEERWLALPPLPAQHRAVFDYGAFRALQQAVRPALLALTRIVVIALVGVAAAGQLEAGRIYTAPALLVVFGLNSFLFASYALDAKSALPAALRRADRGVRLLLAITVAFGVVAVLCVPVLGPLIAGGQYDIPVTTVVGWVVYAISVAAVTPYGALAAVRGLQAAVLAVRVGDSLVSLALAAAVAYVAGSAECVPFGLAVGSFAGGLLIRHYVLQKPPNWSTRD
jgi:O-antigen/teichoic acid export membrane protein